MTTVEIGVSQGRNNIGFSSHSLPINPQQAMAKLVFIVEVLNVDTPFNVTA
jgi:hypothetical protein